MKRKLPSQNEGLQLELQEVTINQVEEVQSSAVELEYIMTNSAFGYEYAVTALDEQESPMNFEAEKIRGEIEDFKRLYFDAREKLKALDLKRLSQVEQDLQMQKILVFAKQKYLH